MIQLFSPIVIASACWWQSCVDCNLRSSRCGQAYDRSPSSSAILDTKTSCMANHNVYEYAFECSAFRVTRNLLTHRLSTAGWFPPASDVTPCARRSDLHHIHAGMGIKWSAGWSTARQVFDPEFRKPFPNVQRYWQTLAAQPQFAKVVGTSWSLPTEALKPPSNKDSSSKPKESKPKVPKTLLSRFPALQHMNHSQTSTGRYTINNCVISLADRGRYFSAVHSSIHRTMKSLHIRNYRGYLPKISSCRGATVMRCGH